MSLGFLIKLALRKQQRTWEYKTKTVTKSD